MMIRYKYRTIIGYERDGTPVTGDMWALKCSDSEIKESDDYYAKRGFRKVIETINGLKISRYEEDLSYKKEIAE